MRKARAACRKFAGLGSTQPTIAASVWLLGGGVEWAINNNWSLKGEYNNIGLSNRNFAVPVVVGGGVVDTFTSSNRNFQMVKFGFNYVFR